MGSWDVLYDYYGAKKKPRRKKKVKRKAKKKPARKPRTKREPVRTRRGSMKTKELKVPPATFNRIREAGGWPNQIPDEKKKTFSYKGTTYWPFFALENKVRAVKIEPKTSYKGHAFSGKADSLVTPGHVVRIGQKYWVFTELAVFVPGSG